MNLTSTIIVRCLNEGRHLPVLLDAIRTQSVRPAEVIVVDSGSTDNTVEIALSKGAKVIHISQQEFSFGRALNHGAAAAAGSVLVFASAHTYPASDRWLELLLEPFVDPNVTLVYGSQRGDHRTKFSEQRIFQQWFPDEPSDDQPHPFCNNANCAVRRSAWQKMPYNEEIPGLEDIHWAKEALKQGMRIVYRPAAAIMHVHEETYRQVYRRNHREGIALKVISPEEHMTLWQAVELFASALTSDLREALSQGVVHRVLPSVVRFRAAQYWGTFRGLRWSGPITSELRARLYYPKGYRPRPQARVVAPLRGAFTTRTDGE